MHAIPKMQHTPSGRKIFIWLHSLYACMLSVTSVGRDRLSNFITQFRNNERVNGQLQSVEKKKAEMFGVDTVNDDDDDDDERTGTI